MNKVAKFSLSVFVSFASCLRTCYLVLSGLRLLRLPHDLPPSEYETACLVLGHTSCLNVLCV